MEYYFTHFCLNTHFGLHRILMTDQQNIQSKDKKLSVIIYLSDQQGCRYGEANDVEWDGNMLKGKSQQIFIYLLRSFDFGSITFLTILVKKNCIVF